MERYMIAQWTAHGWCPIFYPSKKTFAATWRRLHESTPKATFRGFQSVVDNRTPTAFEGIVWEVGDDNFLKEVEAWTMMSLEEQDRLTADFPANSV